MRSATVAGLLLAMVGGGCGGTTSQGGQPDDRPAATSQPQSSVQVNLVDFAIDREPDSVPAGEVTFEVTNDGYATDADGDPVSSISGGQHNFEVLRTDLPAGDLPVSDLNFAVDVEAPGIELSGSVLPLSDGARESLTVDLESGAYVLICNLTSHYQRGMWAELSVR
jgi:uncharacterized cupredoxin-like copper-binding protein